MKRLHLGLFDNPQANGSGPATWRYHSSQRHLFDTLSYWLEIARVCEDAEFDFLFLADAWGWSELDGRRPEICSTESLDLPRLDPAVVAAALIPAGSSPAGRAFGGRHAEAAFLGGGSVAVQADQTKAIRAAAVEAGRRPGAVKVMTSFDCVVAPTRTEAVAKHEPILAAQKPDVAVASYAMFTGLDLSSYDPDTPMTELRTELSQTQVSRFAGMTVGEVLADWATHGVGAAPFVGDAEEVADHLCALAEEADLDGILLHPQVQPPSTIDFVELVLPILRDRGLRPAGRDAATLRQRLFPRADAVLPADHPGAAHRARPT